MIIFILISLSGKSVGYHTVCGGWYPWAASYHPGVYHYEAPWVKLIYKNLS